MVKRIRDRRGPSIPPLGELGPHVLVVGQCGSMLQFTPLESEGSVSPLCSFLDFLQEFGRH